MCGRLITTAALILTITASPALSLEGKWTPLQILQLDPESLRELGLQVLPEQLWDEQAGAGKLSATVSLGGCSAGFVSPDGLLVTNHHCVVGLLQQHSSPERDYLTDGLLADSRAQELPGRTARATVPHRATDVTAVMRQAIPAGASDLDRFRALERKGKELVAECEDGQYRRCRLAVYDDGLQYVLEESLEFPDVRLVYAPPQAVGNFGGDVDNWMWPRHSGDFTLLRVYAGAGNQPAAFSEFNVPYRPPHYFPIAVTGVSESSFVMITGYPGRTFRSLIAVEVEERLERFFPRRAEVFARWLEIMRAAADVDDDARIALAARIRGLSNAEKNARGQIAGLRRGRILETKQAFERQVLAWAAEHLVHRPAVAAYHELEERAQELDRTWEREFLLNTARQASRPLAMALTLVRWAEERELPDLERNPTYMERNWDRLTQGLQRDVGQSHPPTDSRLLADILVRLAALPPSQSSTAAAAFLAGARDPAQAEIRAAAVMEATQVLDPSVLPMLATATPRQLQERNDPLLDLAEALDRELREVERRREEWQGAVRRLRPVWLQAVHDFVGAPVSPDANGTLRVSLARVMGYAPRDGVVATPQTRLAGVVAKHTGEAPFDAPEALLASAPRAARSRWADSELQDVPVCFLADGDTTGGSSGSPVLNGKGELVGINFDRVWENVANDFGYNPDIARNVSVDIRYMLWCLEVLGGERAGWLLRELGVAPVDGGMARW